VRLVVGFEGTQAEVEWQTRQLLDEWRALDVKNAEPVATAHVAELWNRLAEFPAGEAPLVLKASVRPGMVTSYVQRVMAIDPECSIQAHAGNGIVIVRFARFTAADVSRRLIGELQPAAVSAGGHAVVLSSTLELTRQAAWGSLDSSRLMQAVKEQFDPRGILNPGRW
jgi:FAD/FMN-containing dehydrogenase